MQNTSIFHFKSPSHPVPSLSPSGHCRKIPCGYPPFRPRSSACSRATSTPFACTQVAHKLLAKFSREHAPFSLRRCFDNGNYLELSSALSTFGHSLKAEGIDSLERAKSCISKKKKRKFIYIVLWVGCRARVSGICPPFSTFFTSSCRFFVSLIFWFISRFSLNDAKLAGPLASCSICKRRPWGASTFHAFYLYIVVNNFYSQSFAF